MIFRSVPIHGFHDDYAFIVKGLLDLYEANFDPQWLEFAEELQDIQDRLFWDSQDGGYFSTVENSQMILRMKDGTACFCSNFSLTIKQKVNARQLRINEIERKAAFDYKDHQYSNIYNVC